MTIEDASRCPSCGILYVAHPGLVPTCRELIEARAETLRLRESIRTANITWEEIERKMYLAEQQVEAAERERGCYREALERIGKLSTLPSHERSVDDYGEIARGTLKEVGP